MTDISSPETAALKDKLQAEGVKYLMASYVDMHGAIKTKVVPLAHFDPHDGRLRTLYRRRARRRAAERE